jgi:hypothetical protein
MSLNGENESSRIVLGQVAFCHLSLSHPPSLSDSYFTLSRFEFLVWRNRTQSLPSLTKG